MGDNLDSFIDGLQDQIYRETRAAYGDLAFERWQNMRYMGSMENPDGYARITGSCGDTMEIYLKFQNNHVKKASFQTDGCGTSAVCGSFARKWPLAEHPMNCWKSPEKESLKFWVAFPKKTSIAPFWPLKRFRKR